MWRACSVLAILVADASAETCPTVAVEQRTVLIATVRGKSTGAPLAGVTVVASRGACEDAAAITGDDGRAIVIVPSGEYTLTYFLESMTFTTAGRRVEGLVAHVPAVLYESTPEPRCCFCNPERQTTGPEYSSTPKLGLEVTKRFAPVARDRTHRAWIAPVAAADPRTAIATIDDARRLHGAPGIPLAFVDTVTTHTVRVPIALAGGAGGASAVTLRTGGEAGDVRLVLDVDGAGGAAGVEAFDTTRLVRDHAWLSLGLVATPDDTAGMAQLVVAKSYAHSLAIAGIAQDRDRWASARWISRFERLEVKAIATAEQLVEAPAVIARGAASEPATTTRAGGRLVAKQRVRGLGHHEVEVALDAGGGMRGTTDHADAGVALGETWQPVANVELRAGVRADARRSGDSRASVVAPRVSAAYDFTGTEQSDVFVAYQRVSHLDDAAAGEWTTRFHDELAAGVAYMHDYRSPIMIGVAARARWLPDARAELGVETWMRYDWHRWLVHASGTTLGNVGTVVAGRTLLDRRGDTVVANASLRAAPDRTDAGAGVVWRHHAPRARAGWELAVEGYTSGGRALLGINW